MKVRDVMTRNVISVRPETPLNQVVDRTITPQPDRRGEAEPIDATCGARPQPARAAPLPTVSPDLLLESEIQFSLGSTTWRSIRCLVAFKERRWCRADPVPAAGRRPGTAGQ